MENDGYAPDKDNVQVIQVEPQEQGDTSSAAIIEPSSVEQSNSFPESTKDDKADRVESGAGELPSKTAPADATFYNGQTISETRVELGGGGSGVKKLPHTEATEPYAGMGKEDLLRFSQTPYWNKMRLAFLITFWAGWAALLVAVVVLTIVLPRCSEAPDKAAWQIKPMYQVYVRSFYDYDGDGVGDIKGVESKLDYLSGLGVGSLILSSVYQSQDDFGYAVTNHTIIDPQYGTEEDLISLISAARDRGINIILDFIPNHTGDQHPWFTESRASNTNPYSNFYVWQDCGTNGASPPNNWLSVYSLPGSRLSAWNYDATRGLCTLNQFLQVQPELNLRSGRVRLELEAILRYWLERGVGGFRVKDAAFLVESDDLTDDPLTSDCTDQDNYECFDHIHTRNYQENFNLIAQWRAILEEYSDTTQQRLLLVDSDEELNNTLKYYGVNGARGAHLSINYHASEGVSETCGGNCLADIVNDWLAYMPLNTTSNWATSSQDMSRLVSSVGEEYTTAISLLVMTLPGVPITYYGEELGMVDGNMTGVPIEDPAGNINLEFSRDGFRTPMQWSSEDNAGFINQTGGSPSSPWLPVNADYTTKNVESQSGVSDSVLEEYKMLSTLRTEQQAIHLGDFNTIIVNENIYSFVREFNGQNSYMVSINLGNETSEDDYTKDKSGIPGSAEVVMVTHGDMAEQFEVGEKTSLKDLTLQPGQGILLMWPYSR